MESGDELGDKNGRAPAAKRHGQGDEDSCLTPAQQLELAMAVYPEAVEDFKVPEKAAELVARAAAGWQLVESKRRKTGL